MVSPTREDRPGALVQAIRRANLRRVMNDLAKEGIETTFHLAQVLGLSTHVLTRLRAGAAITDQLAREVEWAMNRPQGWLDRPPSLPDI